MKVVVHFNIKIRADLSLINQVRRERGVPDDVIFFTTPEAAGEAFTRPFVQIDLGRFLELGGAAWMADAEKADRVVDWCKWGKDELAREYAQDYWVEKITDESQVPDVEHDVWDEWDGRIVSIYRPFLPEIMLSPGASSPEARDYLASCMREWHDFDDIYSL